jgi:hypothetical protein
MIPQVDVFSFRFLEELIITRVSNGTRFSCPAGQRDRRPLIVPGQRRQRGKEFFLSRDKGTTGQGQNLATGRDGPGFFEAVPSRDVPRDKITFYFAH